MSLRSGPEILKLLDNLEKETKAIIEDIATMAVYSGQSYHELWHLTNDERRIFLKILQSKISLERGIKPKDVITQELR